MKVSLMDLVKPVIYYSAPLSDTSALLHATLQQIKTKSVIDDINLCWKDMLD